MTRLYINITNKCNTNCEFCCMWSGTNKSTFLSFEKYKEIIDDCKDDFELQLEGGEPLLHKGLYLFLEYAVYTGRCKKILILTNGIELHKHIKRFVDFHRNTLIPFSVKTSFNYWLNKINKQALKQFVDYYYSTEFIDGFNVSLNVRLRKHEDENIRKMVESYNLPNAMSIYYFQKYGKYEDEENYDLPIIVRNIDSFHLFSCDGKDFGEDLIARANHEKNLD